MKRPIPTNPNRPPDEPHRTTGYRVDRRDPGVPDERRPHRSEPSRPAATADRSPLLSPEQHALLLACCAECPHATLPTSRSARSVVSGPDPNAEARKMRRARMHVLLRRPGRFFTRWIDVSQALVRHRAIGDL